MTLKNKYLSDIYAAIGKSFFLLLLPVFEVFFLRVYLHQVLKVHLEWAYVTDFDFIVPGPVAFTIYVLVLSRKCKPQLQLQEKVLGANLIAVGTFLVINHYFDRLSLINTHVYILVWIFNFFLIVVTAFSSFISPKFYLKNENRYLFLPILLILFCPLFARRALLPIWPTFSLATGTGVCALLQTVLGDTVQCLQATQLEPRLIIRHTDQAVSIGRKGAGLDTFFLFGYFVLILASLKPKLFKWWRWGVFFSSGIFLGFLLNFFRIASFFYLSIILKGILGEETSIDIFVNLFHLHFGWVFYLVSFIVLFLMCIKWESYGRARSIRNRRKAPVSGLVPNLALRSKLFSRKT